MGNRRDRSLDDPVLLHRVNALQQGKNRKQLVHSAKLPAVAHHAPPDDPRVNDPEFLLSISGSPKVCVPVL